MPKPNPCYESMTRLKVGSQTIRIWRTESCRAEALDPTNKDLKDLVPRLTRAAYRSAMFDVIESCGRIAAIEILESDGNGALYYPDWK